MRNVILLLLLVSVGALAQAIEPFATPDFTINHPSDWKIQTNNFSQALFLYPGTDIVAPVVENFHISVDELSENFSFDSYTFMAKHHVESQFPGAKLLRSLPVKLGKLQGHRFEYAGQYQGTQLQIVQVMFMKDNQGYTLWFVASPANYKRFGNQAETMIRSFKING